MTAAAGILTRCALEERGLAIVPSDRVSAQEFASILKANGLSVRPLGHGSARVVDARGRCVRVGGVLIVAVRSDEVRKLHIHSQLCGVTVSGLVSEIP